MHRSSSLSDNVNQGEQAESEDAAELDSSVAVDAAFENEQHSNVDSDGGVRELNVAELARIGSDSP
jgi:hypothetical protein